MEDEYKKVDFEKLRYLDPASACVYLARVLNCHLQGQGDSNGSPARDVDCGEYVTVSYKQLEQALRNNGEPSTDQRCCIWPGEYQFLDYVNIQNTWKELVTYRKTPNSNEGNGI